MEPHLSFNGQCEAAFRFYEECLGGKISLMLTDGDALLLERTPPDQRNMILYAVLLLGDQRLTGSDTLRGNIKNRKGSQ